ncbi:MAG: polysaccharide deacetylase family protein [Clostridia bacterium]|nr:polysaccharide deacetylase family protein [Clostridia bacterium]
MSEKMKYLTFSYDDGVTQDIRLIKLLDKYGMKCTFNLNSGLLGVESSLLREGQHVDHVKVNAADVRHIYAGHEVAAHTLRHPFLPRLTDDDEVVRQVEEDRLALSELCGYEVVGFAYPGGGVNHDARVASLIRERTGVRYARTTDQNLGFAVQEDLFEFMPTVSHHNEWERLFALGERFLELRPDDRQIFYIWGHSYEFDIHNTWERFEEFLKMMAGRDDIAYVTNREALLSGNPDRAGKLC